MCVFADFGMAAIIVVCVGFLLFMIILGVVRIRAAHRRTQVVHVEEKQEMEWDNSALNITVNPVEQEVRHSGKMGGGGELGERGGEHLCT